MLTSGDTAREMDRESFSPNIQRLFSGLNEPGDCHHSSQPEWLDKDIFKKGRNFYNDYIFCIFFSNLLGLLSMFSIPTILIPLMFTEKSSTSARAMKRYVSTVEHVIRWSEDDIWDPDSKSHQDLQSVRATHKRVSKFMRSSSKEIALDYDSSPCPFTSLIRKDVQIRRREGPIKFQVNSEQIEYLSQFDMVLTQYAFMGFVVAHPRMMGLWWVREEELEGFIHFWRGIGWLLGIDDKYNLCNGSVERVKSLCLDIEQQIIVPHLYKVTTQYEQMSTSLVEGLNMFIPAISFPSMFFYLATTINIKVETLRKRMSAKHFMQYLLMRYTFCCILILPCVIRIFNFLVRLAFKMNRGHIPKCLSYIVKKR